MKEADDPKAVVRKSILRNAALIKRENPFPNLNLAVLEPLGLPHRGFTGQVFKVKSAKGKFYKLRRCDDEKEALRIAKYSKLAQAHIPQFYGRDRRYLLFDFIDGRCLADDLMLKDCHAMGRIYAKVHKIKVKGNLKQEFRYIIGWTGKLLRAKVISQNEHDKIIGTLNSMKKDIDKSLVLEIFDLHPDNFMAANNRVFLIDEGGMHITFRGIGFMKAFEKLSKEQQKEFLNGYRSIASLDYLSKEHETFVMLAALISSTYALAKNGINPDKYLIPLRELLATAKNPFRKVSI